MKIMRKRTILWTVLGVFGFAAVALAAVVMGITQSPRGIATPRVYDYATGAPGAYYLDIPTLAANDTFVGLTLTQTLTNKTLTSPTVTGLTLDGASLTVSTFARTCLDDTTAGAFLTTLGVSSYGQSLIDDAAATNALTTLGFSTFGKTLIDDATGSDVQTTIGITTFAKTILDDTTQGAVQTTIGLGTGDSPTFTGLTLTGGVDTVDYTGTGTQIVGDDAGDSVTIKGVTLTVAGTALFDDATAGDQRITLGLGTLATQNANALAATGGTIDGVIIGGATPANADFDDITPTTLNMAATGGHVLMGGVKGRTCEVDDGTNFHMTFVNGILTVIAASEGAGYTDTTP